MERGTCCLKQWYFSATENKSLQRGTHKSDTRDSHTYTDSFHRNFHREASKDKEKTPTRQRWRDPQGDSQTDRRRLPKDKDGETHRETVRQTGEDSHKTKMERHADRETDRQWGCLRHWCIQTFQAFLNQELRNIYTQERPSTNYKHTSFFVVAVCVLWGFFFLTCLT